MSKKIMLIDGNSIINRAFYAIPLLSNRDGIYTNAVYGFLNIFFKFFDEENPDYIAVSFDLSAPTFRHIKYSEYKANRKKMPNELASQLPILKNILLKMNITIFEKEGFEADDILGTLAKYAEKNEIDAVIVSGDKDLLQIASDNIKIKIPKTKGGYTEVENYFKDDVIQKYEVTPEQFIEVKALMGDSSDNVPGVPSIGEKTAIKIILEFESVENAIINSEKIKPKRASENLKKFRDQALLSKELVTIDTNVPININIDDLAINNLFNNEVYDIIKKLEFKSMFSRFNQNMSISETKKDIYKYIENIDKAIIYFDNINLCKEVSYEILYENDKIIGVAFSSENDLGTFIFVSEQISEKQLLSFLKSFFESDIPKIAHDAKSDMSILRKYGIKINKLIFDTFIAAYILNPNLNSYEYNNIANIYLNEGYPSYEEVFGRGKKHKLYSELTKKEIADFVCSKTYVSLKSKPIMLKKIQENGQYNLYFDIELPLIYVLFEMEKNGIKIDKNALISYRDELQKKIDTITDEIYFLAGEEFNINSPKQLSTILFEKLGLKGGKKTRTGWSTAADVLEKLKGSNKIIDKILDYRTYMKLKTTYADGLLSIINPNNNKIYSTFNQTVTTTGRLSSTEPNLQNIPVKVELGHKLRKVFIPDSDEYVFIDADYSQIELRILAHISKDETLINAFKDGQDIHTLTASQVFGVPFDKVTNFQRSNAKAVNFGIIYGISAFSLSQDLEISRKEAEIYIDGYFSKYPNVKKYMDKSVEEAKKTGEAKTLFGRIRPIPELSSDNFVQRSFGERAAMNMPIQGTAADIIKIAMIKVYNRLKEEGLKSKLILQVHDELLILAHKSEIDRASYILKNEMENAVSLSVSLDVDIHIGNNWYEAK